MEIGIDDLDDYEGGNVNMDENNTITQNITDPDSFEDSNNVDEEPSNSEQVDIISELLKIKGISDSSKIKFQNDNGDVEEVNWDSLNDQEKLSILTSENPTNYDTDLDDSEIQLINAIRSSKMSPQEYMTYIQQQGINNYMQNYQNTQPSYRVDDISDEDLFVLDLVSRVGESNISDEEIETALASAKQNEAVFNKQIEAIRNEYKTLEDRNNQQNLEMQKQQQVQAFNSFAESVENEIRSFKDVCGYDLNMDEDEMEELYDFITGFDDAGNSIFGKVLNNPKALVSMAWFALNGEKAIQEINDYWTNEITQVRKNSYKKGVEDYKNGKFANTGSKLEIRPKTTNISDSTYDLDDF